mgnify:CR=1 FL=1
MEERTYNLKTRQQFKQFVSENKFVVVKITASWCGPCKRCTPMFNEYFQSLPEKFKLVIVDVDEGNLAGMFRSRSVPTFINYINGLPNDIQVGATEEGIKSFFRKTFSRK